MNSSLAANASIRSLTLLTGYARAMMDAMGGRIIILRGIVMVAL